MGIGTEVLIVLLLLVANGVFAMSEIAVVSARKARLQQRADEGDHAARRALQLAERPERFLATVQVGITLVGTLAGAFGGAAIAEPLAGYFATVPTVARYAEPLALGLVVMGITYMSLIVGELVPKQIGLNHPERIAGLVAGPMDVLSRVARPLVWLLTTSTQLVLRVLRIRKPEDPPVTEAEITVLLEQGTQAGVFEEEEQELVERVFWLGDQRVVSLMTPRHRIVWLDVDASVEEHRHAMVEHRYSRYLVCQGALDHVLGMVDVKDLWAAELRGQRVDDLRPLLRQPLFIPESTRALHVLEQFRETGTHLALVVNEYGGTEGIVTLNDVLEEIAGEMGQTGRAAVSPPIVRRDDGSLLVDGSLSMEEFRELLDLEDRRQELREYRTLGGWVFTTLGHVPRPGEHFDANGYRVEVVDMDGNRIDKVLVAPLARPREDREPAED
ncbi:hemolysin family protein [Longimicrobium sp.]|uniref:hemolysin family protein n=1 Tax=Longimicrobium sp. TaxID=2029185 RepID=UPI002E37FFE2|nr:hemolysin family protein [Longimicrobium sp.]HEX6037644.1 hemolysin family protein [Longimicrobium sp.]